MSQSSMICRTIASVVLLALAVAAPKDAQASADSAVRSDPESVSLPSSPMPSVAFGCQECMNPIPYQYDSEGNVYGLAGAPCTDSSGLVPPLYCARCDFGDCSGWGYYTLPCNQALCTLGHEEDAELLAFAVDENDAGLIAELILSRRAFLFREKDATMVIVNKCDGSILLSRELHLDIERSVLAAITVGEERTP